MCWIGEPLEEGGREEAWKVIMDLAQLPPIFLPAAVGNPLPLPALSDLKMQCPRYSVNCVDSDSNTSVNCVDHVLYC